MNESIHYQAVLDSLIACLPECPAKSCLSIALTEGYRNGEPKWMDMMETALWESELTQPDFHHQLYKTACKDDGGFEEWFDKLWNGFPKQQHDGTSAPFRSKKVCKERLKAVCKKHKRKPEQVVRAIAAYVNDCFENKRWIKSLDTVLGPQEVWAQYIVEPKFEQAEGE